MLIFLANASPNVVSTYTYDVLGRPLDVDHSDGQSIHYGYDAVGNRTGMRTEINGTVETYVTYAYDSLNRITDVFDHESSQVPVDPTTWATDAAVTPTEMTYNPIGLMTGIIRPNGVNTSYTYDPQRYFVDEIQHLHTTNGLMSQYQYDYDNVGNRTQMIVNDGTNSSTYNYAYDDAYRMLSESQVLTGGTQSTTSYLYDDAGNRTQMIEANGDEANYTYNADNELTRIDYSDFTHDEYTYDARGNLIQVAEYDASPIPVQVASTSYGYNAKDQLTSFGINGSTQITYDYDYLGNRVEESLNGALPMRYLWDEFSRYGDVVLQTEDNAGTLSKVMSYTLADGQLISQSDASANVHYFLQDALNSTVALADTTGSVTSTYSYDAFGNLDESIPEASVESDYLFTGQWFDSDNDLYNLRARQYNPMNGRFTSRDKYPYSYGNPIELNRYTYATNNPVTHTDPSGNSILSSVVAYIGQQAATRHVGFATGFIGGSAVAAISATLLWANANARNCGSNYYEWSRSVTLSGFVASSMAIGGALGGLVGAYPELTTVSLGVGIFFSSLAFASDPNFCTFASMIMSFAAGGGQGNTLNFGNSTIQVAITSNTPALQLATASSGISVTVGAASTVAGVSSAATAGLLSNWFFSMNDPDPNDNEQEGSSSDRPEIRNYQEKHRNKHLPDTPQSEREIRRGSAHVFNDNQTLENVVQQIVENGEYTGTDSNGGTTWERWGMYFDEPIGYRIGRDGNTTPLRYGEIKIDVETRDYHAIPRTRPRGA